MQILKYTKKAILSRDFDSIEKIGSGGSSVTNNITPKKGELFIKLREGNSKALKNLIPPFSSSKYYKLYRIKTGEIGCVHQELYEDFVLV